MELNHLQVQQEVLDMVVGYLIILIKVVPVVAAVIMEELVDGTYQAVEVLVILVA